MATTLGSIKDIVREHLSRTSFPTVFLDLALAGGRREVEKGGNYYWMRNIKNHDLVAAQQDYSITTSTTNGLNLPDFKDVRRLFWKKSTDTAWAELDLTRYGEEDAILNYKTTGTGSPEIAIVSNTTLTVWPIPDSAATYNTKLFYYNWTDNPTGNTGSDELTNRWTEALIAGAMIWANEMELKDIQGAAYWRQMLDTEIVKLRRYSLEREWLDEIMITVSGGPYSTRKARFRNYSQTSY